MIDSLDVYIWNEKVGTLISTSKRYREEICFYFDSNFIKGPWDVAPLRASIKATGVINGFPVYSDIEKIFAGLPSFIADSLPDKWGDTVFREWASKKGISMKKLSSLDRLAYIGRRGMGAFEFLPPATHDFESPFKIQIEELFEVAEQTFQERRGVKVALSSDLQIENLFKVGTSAGGRRPKAILNVNYDTGICYSGQVEAPEDGFTPVIIKFDEGNEIPTTRIEYSYYLMARSAGLNIMPSRLIETGGHTHFVTERFDRKGNDKIHTQTLAAMSPLSDSYEDLFGVAERLNLPRKEKEQIFLLMVMNLLTGNVDDHSKNFSFLMGRDGIWHFAPAYDFTFTIDVSAPEYVNRHSLTVNGKNRDITKDDLVEMAKKFNIGNPGSMIEKAVAAVSRYETFAEEAGLPSYWRDRIQKEISSIVK